MVAVALALRLVVVALVYPERTDPARDHWRCGGEAGRVARSIAQGEGFSNPLFGKTGPTAWLAPVFPYLLAAIFKIFGIYSKTSTIVALALDSLFSALTCIPVFLHRQETLWRADGGDSRMDLGILSIRSLFLGGFHLVNDSHHAFAEPSLPHSVVLGN
jgi:hypothetical protein